MSEVEIYFSNKRIYNSLIWRKEKTIPSISACSLLIRQTQLKLLEMSVKKQSFKLSRQLGQSPTVNSNKNCHLNNNITLSKHNQVNKKLPSSKKILWTL